LLGVCWISWKRRIGALGSCGRADQARPIPPGSPCDSMYVIREEARPGAGLCADDGAGATLSGEANEVVQLLDCTHGDPAPAAVGTVGTHHQACQSVFFCAGCWWKRRRVGGAVPEPEMRRRIQRLGTIGSCLRLAKVAMARTLAVRLTGGCAKKVTIATAPRGPMQDSLVIFVVGSFRPDRLSGASCLPQKSFGASKK